MDDMNDEEERWFLQRMNKVVNLFKYFVLVFWIFFEVCIGVNVKLRDIFSFNPFFMIPMTLLQVFDWNIFAFSGANIYA